MIYGEFDNRQLRFNGNVAINRLNYPGYGLIIGHVVGQSPTYTALYVYGDAYSSGSFVSGSDERWKKDVTEVKNVLPHLTSLRAVTFDWKRDEFPEMEFEDKRQIGFIAQEVEKYFPELIRLDHNGFKLLDYPRMSVILLEAIKEQQVVIETQQAQIESIVQEFQKLKEIGRAHV